MSRRMPKKYNDPKLSASVVSSIVTEVKRKNRVSTWDVAMIYGSTNGLFDSGELVEENGFVVLAIETAVVEVKPVATPRPNWIPLNERRAIADQLIEFVLAQVPSLEKLGKKEIAQLNSQMPTDLANDVTLTSLSKSTRGLTWGKPVKCLLVGFTYFTGMKDDRTIELKEAVVAPEPQQDELDRQIAEGKQSVDPAYRQHAQMLQDCTKGDWLDQVVAEIQTEQELTSTERKVA